MATCKDCLHVNVCVKTAGKDAECCNELLQEKHGEWKEWWPGSLALIMTGEEMLWMCSECTAKYSDKENMTYCPNCGAKMDGKDTNVPTKAMDGGKAE